MASAPPTHRPPTAASRTTTQRLAICVLALLGEGFIVHTYLFLHLVGIAA